MKSFSDFRKSQLKRDIYAVSVREGLNRHFDMLKMDLFETSELPPMLFENNFLLNSAYEFNRKLDHEEVKELIGLVISDCKSNFYDYLISEDATAASEFSSLHTELIARVKQMVAELKAAVGNALGKVRSTGEEDPEETPAGTSATSAPSAGASVSHSAAPGMASKTMATPPNKSASPSSAAVAPSSPGSATSTPASAGSSPGTSTGPAAYGSMRPSDGFFKGAGRLAKSAWGGLSNAFKKLTRPIRRVWHNDPTRENIQLLLPLFNENADAILNIIDKFGTDLIQYIGDRIGTIAGTVAANGGLSPAANATTLGDGKTKGPAGTNPGLVSIDAGPAATGTDPKVINPDKESSVERMAAGGDPAAQKTVDTHWDYFHHALNALGMDSSYTRGWGGEKIKKKKLIIDGKHVTDETASAIAKQVYQRIFTRIMKSPETSPWLANKGLSKKLVKAVQQYVGGLKVESPNKLDGLLELILKLGKKLKTGSVGEPIAPEAPAVPPRDMNTPPTIDPEGERRDLAPPVSGHTGAKTNFGTAPIDAKAPSAADARTQQLGDQPPSEAVKERVTRFKIDNKDLIDRVIQAFGGESARKDLDDLVAAGIEKKGEQAVLNKLQKLLGEKSGVEPTAAPAAPTAAAPAATEETPPVADDGAAIQSVRTVLEKVKSQPGYEDVTNDMFTDDQIKQALAKSKTKDPVDVVVDLLDEFDAQEEPEAAPEAAPETPTAPEATPVTSPSPEATGGDPVDALLNSTEWTNLRRQLVSQAEEILNTREEMTAFRKAISLAAEDAMDEGKSLQQAMDAASEKASEILLSAAQAEKDSRLRGESNQSAKSNRFQKRLEEYKLALKNIHNVTESKYQNLRKRMFAN